MTTSSFDDEVARGERYLFGENWQRFLHQLSADRIAKAEASLCDMLGTGSLAGKLFLDIGSGSGLFSLAARRLGARVVSLDFDPQSVACTTSLRDRFLPDQADWLVTRGSVLDDGCMQRLPMADIVYSWGVLHHTGRMFDAIRNAAAKVAPGGLFCVALYRKTVFCGLWRIEKRFFNSAGPAARALLRSAWIAKTRLGCLLRGRSFAGLIADYAASSRRGMDFYRDVDDWLGGYPYESITPAECRDYLGTLGFELVREQARTDRISLDLSSGCDEWVFRRRA